MRSVFFFVVLCALALSASATVTRPVRKASFLQRKLGILPHPDQRYRKAVSELPKTTPGGKCSELTTCEQCSTLHICVWTKPKAGGEPSCLDERNPLAVYGSRESCPGQPKNSYRDVKTREEDEKEETANMIGNADLKEGELKGDRVVTAAIDKTEPQVQDPHESNIKDHNPKWMKGAETTVETYYHYPTKRVVKRKKVTVTKTTGGAPKPASGGQDALGGAIDATPTSADGSPAEGTEEEAPVEAPANALVQADEDIVEANDDEVFDEELGASTSDEEYMFEYQEYVEPVLKKTKVTTIQLDEDGNKIDEEVKTTIVQID